MAALSIYRSALVSKIIRRNVRLTNRLISTSGKKKDSKESCPPPESLYGKVPDFSKPLENKNWVSFGVSDTDREEDVFYTHLSHFLIISCIFGGTFFVINYYPDWNMDNWAQREAYIRLHEREQLELDPIDINYVDPDKINLPPDEEINDEDIIV